MPKFTGNSSSKRDICRTQSSTVIFRGRLFLGTFLLIINEQAVKKEIVATYFVSESLQSPSKHCLTAPSKARCGMGAVSLHIVSGVSKQSYYAYFSVGLSLGTLIRRRAAFPA